MFKLDQSVVLNFKITRKTIIKRCLHLSCPNCGKAKIASGLIFIHEKCPSCGMPIKRSNGFYIGPICINYGLIAFFLICPILVLGYSGIIPLNFSIILSFIASFLFPVLFYSRSWGLWLMLYYLCLPNELFENRSENSDDLLFDEDQRLWKEPENHYSSLNWKKLLLRERYGSIDVFFIHLYWSIISVRTAITSNV